MGLWSRLGIFSKILFSILVASLVPLVILGGLALHSANDAGLTAIARSRTALDAKTAEALELRAVEIADAVAHFLEARETDVRTLALLPPDGDAYLDLYHAHYASVWEADGQRSLPLYREIAFIAPDGRETVKVSAGKLAAPSELHDLSSPQYSQCPGEAYFSQAIELPKGEVYVSPVTGHYLSPDTAQAGAEKPQGQRYDGLVRWAIPVYEEEALLGLVTLAMDHRHLQEFTDHVVPTSERFSSLPDATTGNYAYLVDSDGWVIAHPRDYYIRGLRTDGSLVEALNETDQQAQESRGEVPLNLAELGFKDSNLPLINEQAQMGRAGSITYYWAGLDKFVAYAPIPYHSGRYGGAGGFGWVGLGADVRTFHQAAMLVGAAIQEKVRTLTIVTLAVSILTALAVLLISRLLARQIAVPIQELIEAAHSVERGEFQPGFFESLLRVRSQDEIAHLAQVFHQMALRVWEREQQLRQEVQHLRIEIDEARTAKQVAEITETEYFRYLRQYASEMRQRAKGH